MDVLRAVNPLSCFRQSAPRLLAPLLCLGAAAAVAVAVAAAAMLPAQGEEPLKPFKALEPLEHRASKALRRSRPALLRHLGTADGGQLALLCLAAAHDSVPVTNRAFAGALKRLSKTQLTRTYDLSIRLMLMADLASYPDRRSAAIRDARHLLENQAPSGGFSYGEGKAGSRWDLSNSQYAALGMRAALDLGVKIPKKCWRRLAEEAITAQEDDGGFTYTRARAGGRQAYSSMTVAGIAVLQICGQHLDSQTIAGLEMRRRIEHAWDWMAEHKSDIGNRRTRNCLYFHYGLERACILSDVEEIEGTDWYRTGAEMLLAGQLEGGGWTSNDIGGGTSDKGAGNPVSTAFAILFLRRRFQKLLGPITPGGGIRVSHLDSQATREEIDEAVAAEVLRGIRVVPDLIRSLHSPIEARRKAALLAVILITGEDFRYNPHLPPARNRDALKRAELWWLRRGGG